jgi:hypothetical protein
VFIAAELMFVAIISDLFTFAHARRSASFLLTPRFL